jgi:GcrA cell cycle regulator
MTAIAWTDERVETLKRLWSDGLSAAQVARALGGVTRNAVIGKLHRLKLTGSRPRPPARRSAPRPRRQSPTLRRPPRPMAAPAARAPCETPEGAGLVGDLVELARGACRWPIGDPQSAAFSFCGRSSAGGPYCEGHHRIAHRPGKAAPLADDPLVRRALAGERV